MKKRELVTFWFSICFCTGLMSCQDSTPQETAEEEPPVVCQPSEEPCGLNNRGIQKLRCEDNRLVQDASCVDPDICEDDEEQEVPCGIQGLHPELCVEGQWTMTGECEEPPCTENAARRIPCATQEGDEQIQICTEGQWANEGACIPAGICSEQRRRVRPCGINNRGGLPQQCLQGQWVEIGPCADPDLCVDDTAEFFTCGPNERGGQLLGCFLGQWVEIENEPCDDEDVCANGLFEELPCGLNDRGTRARQCVDGQWNTAQICQDSDVCVDGMERIGVCDQQNAIPTAQACVRGQWEASECDDPCQNGDIAVVRCGKGLGQQQSQCTDGVWLGQEECRMLMEEVAPGQNHTCGRLATGAVYCWGEGQQGQLGDNEYASTHRPVQTLDIDTAITLTAGTRHTCALLADGHVTCWGRQHQGASWLAGAGTCGHALHCAQPLQCQRVTGKLAAHLRAQPEAPGSLLGVNDASDLVGNYTLPDQTWTQLALAHYHLCALSQDGDVYCWAPSGRIQSIPTSPTRVEGLTNVTQITAGDGHTCALLASQEVYCWGNNDHQQVGVPEVDYVTSPSWIQLPGLATQVRARGDQTCALLADQNTYCWGSNTFGMLGDTTLSDTPTPTLIPDLEGSTALFMGTRPRLRAVRRWTKPLLGCS